MAGYVAPLRRVVSIDTETQMNGNPRVTLECGHTIVGVGYYHYDPERGGLTGDPERYPKRKRCPRCPKVAKA